MKKFCRSLCFVLTLVMILSLIPAVQFFAARLPEIGYTFENGIPGDGQGVLTVSYLSGSGYCSLYFADDTAALSGYEPIAVIAESGTSVSVTLPRAFLLPPQATKIAAYESAGKTPGVLDLAAAVAVYDVPASKKLPSGDPSMTFASVSDVHLNYDDNGYGASTKWTAALNFFDEKGMDAVVISGDITSSGGTTDYNRYANATAASTYPASKIYEAQGNHDSTQVARFLSYTQGEDDVHPFEGSAWFHVLFEGENGARDNLFIFMAQELTSTSGTPTTDNFSARQLDWVEGLLQTYAGTETNIFIVEHSMIRNFGPGDKYNGVYVEPMYFKNSFPGNIRFKSLLTEYKEAIMMSGHTHLSFYDGYNYGDENGTAARMIHNSSTAQPRCYTASGSISYDSEGRTTATKGSEGYLVYVYDDAVCYVGYNLTTREAIPTASYLIPLYSEDRSAAVSIEVTTPPAKTDYAAGEWFDGTGMVVTATYADGTTAEVKGWGCSNVGELAASDSEVLITYGDCTPVAVPISIAGGGSGDLEGSGTIDDPYIIATADDFATLTALFNACTDSSDPYGSGKYFRQTADIDMTGYPGYTGTYANGNAKCHFGGFYDGGGHTLTVNIESTDQTSVFPYIYGAIINLKFKGSISSGTSAQPIRTMQSGSVIANVVIDMTLTSSNGNGVCYSSYGTMFNVYVTGVASHAAYNTNTNGKYYHVFTNVKNSSGSALTHSTCTASSDLDAIAAAFNDREDDAFTAGIAALTARCPAYGADALGTVTVENGELILSGGAYGDDPGTVDEPDFEGSGTKADPYLIETADDFKKLTDLFNGRMSSAEAYGKGEFFLQTADIDMTGYAEYEGTHANGNATCYFGGIYDGDGHTLTVNIESEGQTSVFPYVTGAILNLKFAGTIVSDYSAQPIRTVRASAVVANVVTEMTLTSARANGVCYTQYGTLFNVYASGVATNAVYLTDSNGKYYHVYTNMKNASGAAITDPLATASSDGATIAAAFNDRSDSAFTSGVSALTAVDASLTADVLLPVHGEGAAVVFGEPGILVGDVNEDGTLTISDVTALLDILAGSGGSFLYEAANVNGDLALTIADVTALLDILSGAVS